MATFSLVDEPWIPCLQEDGTAIELGLREVLVRAPALQEIRDPSPLVTAALHRLLLVVLHRTHGPRTMRAWRDIWNRGSFDVSALDGYFAEWRHRFDLFDAERPFYQVAQMEESEPLPVQQLMHEAATGNNPTLFDHSRGDAPTPLTPAQAARLLVATQAFALGGGNSKPFYLSDAPLTRGFIVLPAGESLFETLALNTVVYNDETPVPIYGVDLPVWEQMPLAEPDKNGTLPHGYLDLLTFLSRRIQLLPEADGSVRQCRLLQNLKLSDQAPPDPAKGYWKDEKRGLRPILLREDRALWRDSAALFEETGSVSVRPGVFNHLARVRGLRQDGAIEARQRYAFSVLGMATEPGKNMIHLWRHERLPLPLAYLDDENLRSALKQALAATEEVFRELERGLWLLARALLAATSDAPDPDKKAVQALRDSFRPGLRFWPCLEAPFSDLLVRLAEDLADDGYGNMAYGGRELSAWRERLQDTAWAVFDGVTRSQDGSARALRAAAEAERSFAGRLRMALAGSDKTEGAPAAAGNGGGAG